MALSHLLDTSVFCQPIKDIPQPGIMERWSGLGETAVCSSAICLAEVLQGLEQRESAKYWRRYRELLAGRYVILSVDGVVAAEFGKLAAELKAIGKPKPAMDLFIAATARRHGLIVATLNPRHFLGLPGVEVEDWGL